VKTRKLAGDLRVVSTKGTLCGGENFRWENQVQSHGGKKGDSSRSRFRSAEPWLGDINEKEIRIFGGAQAEDLQQGVGKSNNLWLLAMYRLSVHPKHNTAVISL